MFGSKLINYNSIYRKHISRVFQLYKLSGKPLQKLIHHNSQVCLLTTNLVGNTISFVYRKVARGIGVIIKARKVPHGESLNCLYNSLTYPYMIYCNQVWGSTCKTSIEVLLILQKRAIRSILGVHPRSP